ncbi:MAG: cysteine--tRNA ligase [Solobacterium sp.]|nr:cysteine--tRNA ligase [Solobacterium sp.]MDY4493700.1 cysteine--tRNA ligase [Erysipelotrichaceae bacterium]MDY5402609.1 cysteine--tRNA ligase [Erysipelotrichaceae bacterium]
MKIYNTKTLKKEEFKPITEGEVKMYVCGPTVYDNVHIGNVRPVVVFDTLRRTFEELGYKVKYVSNYTDVDDKIIRRSKELGISEKELTDKMIAAYNDIRHKLNAADLYKTPRVTETMDEIISFIDGLVDKGAAYEKDGDVYFRTSSVADYGSLSNQNLDDLQVGARIEENDLKESPLDFALWKKTEDGIKWPTRYSIGRPGWHTECVVMINKELGSLIDIHGGGKDLKFPHHENERAQSMAINESELANYWVHSGMIDINGVKMSKSLGNFITAKDILSKVDPMVLRWFLLATQYRDDVNVSDEIIESSKAELTKIITAYKQACVKLEVNDIKVAGVDDDAYKRFMDAMADDLNTPNAYAVIFEIVKNINQLVRVKEINFEALGKEVNTLVRCMNVLGIVLPDMTMSDDDKKMYQEWMDAKSVKDFKKADELRAQLSQKGIL